MCDGPVPVRFHREHNARNRETNRIGVLCQNDRGETIAEQRHDNHNDTTASGRLRSAALPAFGSLSIHTTAISHASMWHVMDPAPRKAALARSGLSTDHYKAPATAQTATPHAPRP